MPRTTLVAILAVAMLVAVAPAMAAGGSRQDTPSRPSTPEPEKTPEELATEHYNWGIAERDRAWKLEEELAAAGDEKSRRKLEKKRDKAYTRAAREFEAAVRENPQMFQAHSDLGYCRRKLGDYDAALAAYDTALAIAPGYPEAVEYRAEAHLGLGRIEEAKAAYLELFGGKREYADKLLAAMTRWIDEQRGSAGSMDRAELDAFTGWVKERQEIAGQTKSISKLPQHRW